MINQPDALDDSALTRLQKIKAKLSYYVLPGMRKSITHSLPTPVKEIPDEPFLVDVMSEKQKRQLGLLIGLWFVAFVVFWMWWLNNQHVVDSTRFIINTLVICWTVLMPAYFLFFIYRMKKPNPGISIPQGLKVAMEVTKAPSEPFRLLMKTLYAMIAQKYPHDTWLADEDPSEKTIAWCEKHNVRISSRKGIEDYHRSTWPRRTKCKEGNLAYFYDHYGYDNYDIVVQLDADHKPGEGYLEEMIRPFLDPKVGYVSAPCLCVSNLDKSWTARGRTYAEANVHGPMQAGYSNDFAPLCIGSHYAVRTMALKQIGGIGPELAEDHSTSYTMNAYGWRGVHALEAKATGDGPLTFADFVTQEFQWSKSVTTLLLTLTPRLFRNLRTKLQCQFLFAQLWYTMLGTTLFLSFLIPPIALLTKTPWVKVIYLDFMMYSTILMSTVVAAVVWIKKNGWTRPVDTKIFSWELMMFHLTRWPWVLMGVFAAIKDLITGRITHFKVTPKGESAAAELPLKVLMPYTFIALISALPAIFIEQVNDAIGYYFFSILNSSLYALVVLVIIVRHIYETKKINED